MNKAKFTITYYYERYELTNDINKQHKRTAMVYADSLAEAIQKVKEFDSNFITLAENGVDITERLKDSKKQIV